MIRVSWKYLERSLFFVFYYGLIVRLLQVVFVEMTP